VEAAAPAPGPATPALPALPGLAFLGLPPLPQVGLPYVVSNSAEAPAGGLAPAAGPAVMDHGDSTGAPAISAALAPVYSAALTSFAVRPGAWAALAVLLLTRLADPRATSVGCKGMQVSWVMHAACRKCRCTAHA
jgi:hypothetical protein